MTRKHPPTVTEHTRFGPDRDLEREVVRDVDGHRVTSDSVDALIDAAARKRGRPGLSATGSSPSVAFRLSPELRAAAEALARSEGKTVSALAREALEARLRAS